MQVLLNVYDVSTAAAAEESPENKGSDTIVKLNNVTRQLGLGGVFHGAVEINGWEWSFGYCEKGTGVYKCHPKKNPMYVFRETIDLGVTLKTRPELDDMLRSLKQRWPGLSYDLLSRNCCHFCEEFCKSLEVKPVPAWLNRFASSADATVTFANDTVVAMRALSEGISRSAQTSVSWVKDSWQRMLLAQQQQQQQQSQAQSQPHTQPHPSADPTAAPYPTPAPSSSAGTPQPPRPASARISGWFKDVAERIGGVNSQQPANAPNGTTSTSGSHTPKSSPPSFNLAPAVHLPFSRHRRSSNCSSTDCGSPAGDAVPSAAAAVASADHASPQHRPGSAGQRQQQEQAAAAAVAAVSLDSGSAVQGAVGASADVQLVVSGTPLAAAKPAPQAVAAAALAESLI